MAVSFLEELSALHRGAITPNTDKYISARATVDMPAGVFAVRDGDGVCSLPNAAGDVDGTNGELFATIYDPSRPKNANGLEWATNDLVQGAKRGPVCMVSEEALTAGDDVYVRITAKGGNTQLGAVRNDSDGDGAETCEITVVSSADGAVFEITINGTKFQYTSGSSETTTDKAAALAAIIDAEAGFGAANVANVVTVTPTSGQCVFEDVPPASIATVAAGADSDPVTAVKLPGAKVVRTWATGLALITFDID